MPRLSLSLFALAAAVLTPAAAFAQACPRDVSTICFTPGGDCRALIVSEISRAKRELLILAYSFTDKAVAKAVSDARKRGVSVRAVLDKDSAGAQYSAADYLAGAGVETSTDGTVAIAHNKVMVIDRQRVITGSYNFSAAANDKNAENVVVLCGEDIAGMYATYWESRRAKALPYTARSAR